MKVPVSAAGVVTCFVLLRDANARQAQHPQTNGADLEQALLAELHMNPFTQRRFARQFAPGVCQLLGKDYDRHRGECATSATSASPFTTDDEQERDRALGGETGIAAGFYAGEAGGSTIEDVAAILLSTPGVDPLEPLVRVLSGEEDNQAFAEIFLHRVKRYICRMFAMGFDGETGECDPNPSSVSDVNPLQEHILARFLGGAPSDQPTLSLLYDRRAHTIHLKGTGLTATASS